MKAILFATVLLLAGCCKPLPLDAPPPPAVGHLAAPEEPAPLATAEPVAENAVAPPSVAESKPAAKPRKPHSHRPPRRPVPGPPAASAASPASRPPEDPPGNADAPQGVPAAPVLQEAVDDQERRVDEVLDRAQEVKQVLELRRDLRED